jgi:pyruvate dehydrogenase E1 component alpha subunit
MYRNMVRGRKYDQALIEMCAKSQVPGMWHSGIGHEAVHVGISTFLRQDDWLGLTHRGVTAGLAKGLDAGMFLAEHLGRAGGYAKGKGGHFCGDREHGLLPVTMTIGGSFPIATGAGIAAKNEGKGKVVVSLFGEGAAQRGTLHESMNMASVWNLPVVWVCENNQYFITTHAKDSLATGSVVDFASGYGMPGLTVDGMDALKVTETVMEAVERARDGGGPSLIECNTYRFREHGEFDIPTDYRTKDEVKEWRELDPIKLFRERLIGEGAASEGELDVIDGELDLEVKETTAWALASPEPHAEEAFTDLYAD